MPTSFAVIVAAGRGLRLGGETPKQYLPLGGKAVLRHSLDAFLLHPAVERVLVVIGAGDDAAYTAATRGVDGAKLLPPVIGGETRQESVRNGLLALDDHACPDDVVLIHDAARPFLSSALIERGIAAAREHGAAIPTVAINDTLKQLGPNGAVAGTVDRATVRAVQTPQCFRYGALTQAHQAATEAGRSDFTDDSGVCDWAGLPVVSFEGEMSAFKITGPADLERASALRGGRTENRTATGYDVHALGEGDHVWLCGVKIAHDRGLIGHSDADPVLHAITDAILGALGDGDIGVHFPPSDPQWRGATSTIFLKDAVRRVRERGGRIIHLDATVVCEAPKIGPHREAMRACVAEAADITLDRVGLKATTSEGLGFTGRREGIAALATATLELPA